MKIIKSCKRLNSYGALDSRGMTFVNPRSAQVYELSSLKLLRCGVDTVRQIYKGRLKSDVLALFETAPCFVSFAGYSWHAGRVGRDSGYQFKLQNSDLGLIILLKNFNIHPSDLGSHLKIEVSPHLIEQNSPQNLQKILDKIAFYSLDDYEHNSCAVHIALDVQGWQPDDDLLSKMNCRSTKIRDISGFSSYEIAANASSYGRAESFLFGSPSAVQLAIYDKTKEAKFRDKLDFWRSQWIKNTDCDLNSIYDDSLPVWRIEMRFHHSVIKQFAAGSYDLHTGEIINTKTYSDLVNHLFGLWKYGFDAFRLLTSNTERVIVPEWSVFRDDVYIETGVDCLHDRTEYKRKYKTASGFSGKNIELFLGNFVSIIARERVGATKAFDALKQWDCFDVILEFFKNKGLTERDIYYWIRDKLKERVIRWGVAI